MYHLQTLWHHYKKKKNYLRKFFLVAKTITIVSLIIVILNGKNINATNIPLYKIQYYQMGGESNKENVTLQSINSLMNQEPIENKLLISNWAKVDELNDNSYTIVFPRIDFEKNVAILQEQQGVKLTYSLGAWNGINKCIKPKDPEPELFIFDKIKVSSYLLLFNPPIPEAKEFKKMTKSFWVGEITFDKPILGVISGFYNSINWTIPNEEVGLANLEYNIHSTWDTEEDKVTINGNTLSFVVGARLGTEPLRVILRDEPTTTPERFILLKTREFYENQDSESCN